MSDAARLRIDVKRGEKLPLVEDLWDDIELVSEEITFYDWQLDEVERRMANLKTNPASGKSWSDVKRRITLGEKKWTM